jgi:hypothetical protein
MEGNIVANALRDRPTDVLPESRPRGAWPAGLIGAVGLIALSQGLIARNPGDVDVHSRLGASWESAYRSAAGDESRAEILCFGDSLIKLGILPRVLEACLGQSAYNMAVLGGQPPTAHFLLRHVLESGHRPRALIVNFSPLLLGMDPRVGLEWWATLPPAAERLELAWRAGDPALAASLILHGAMLSLSCRDAFRTAVGFASFETARQEERPATDERDALLRNWRLNRGAQVAPRPFVPIQGSLPRPYDGAGWRWQPHPVHAYYADRFLDQAQALGIPVFWILPPAEAGWLDRNARIGTLGAYRRYVRENVARFPVLTVLDMQRAGWDRSWFRDPIHLNRDGAIRLTLAVADAIARVRTTKEQPGRWVTPDDGGSAPPRPFQELLEDLDQSRLAVNAGESGPITMEGPR